MVSRPTIGALFRGTRRRRLTLLLVAAGALCLSRALAAQGFAACAAPVSLLPEPAALQQRSADDAPVEVDADRGVFDRATQTYDFTGDVRLERADQTIDADHLRYHAATNRADVSGNVLIEDSVLSLSAEEGYLYTQQSRGQLSDVQFKFKSGYSHGSAEQAHILDDSRSRFDRARFTACPPGEEDWWMNARSVSLDQQKGVGVARHAYVSFLGVPLFYTPYVSFPIDDRRKSGLLPPRIGYSSGEGLDLTTPYYLNLAPNYDATLSPRVIGRRGLLMGIEARWLTPGFATLADLAYLPDDKLYRDDRWAGHWELNSLQQGPLYFGADLNRVSDQDYQDDFGDSLATVSETSLASSANVGYQGERWRLNAQVQNWQNLDPLISGTALPYRVLPRLTLGYRGPSSSDLLSYGMGAELVRFDHRDDNKVTGKRLDAMPTLSLNYQSMAYFAIPTLRLRHTQYQLQRPNDPAAPEQVDRSLPIFSFDSGVFLERPFSLGGRDLMQTLEPRLFYLYVPYRDQRDLPNFDTSLAELTLGQLFSDNRFIGADRVGDANQLSLALGTRVLDQTSGREFLYAAVGQAFYFEDRRVQLAGGAPETRTSSALLAEARASIADLTVYADYHWDPREHRSGRSGLRLSYRPDEWRAINLGYRRRTALLPGEALEQTELSVVWPITDHWLGLGGWHYSLLERTTLERFAGFAYKNCCWSLRGVAREHVNRAGDEPSLAFMFQLELTGLGSLGKPLDEFLLETISGYPFQR